jgi:hypothetical protein
LKMGSNHNTIIFRDGSSVQHEILEWGFWLHNFLSFLCWKPLYSN